MSRKLYIERELLWKIVHFKEVIGNTCEIVSVVS